MGETRLSGILLVCFFLITGVGSPAMALSLSVRIEKVKPLTGVLYISLFSSSEGFPGEYRKAIRTANRDVSESTEVFRFDELPAGEFAVSVLHDENRNGKMDFTVIGAPAEGYGASNDAHRWFGPPRWDDARFRLDSDLSLTIHLR